MCLFGDSSEPRFQPTIHESRPIHILRTGTLQSNFLVHGSSFAAAQLHQRQTRDVRNYFASTTTTSSTRSLLFPTSLCSPAVADARSQLFKNVPIV